MSVQQVHDWETRLLIVNNLKQSILDKCHCGSVREFGYSTKKGEFFIYCTKKGCKGPRRD